jgi:hypothetical protein
MNLERYGQRRFKQNSLTMGARFTFPLRTPLKELINSLSGGSDSLTLSRVGL